MEQNDLKRYVETFLEESFDLCANLSDDILSIESSEEIDLEIVNGVFRAFHTLKSNADGLGFTNICQISHQAETILDSLRNRSQIITETIITNLLNAVDQIHEILLSISTTGFEPQEIESSREMTTKSKDNAISDNEHIVEKDTVSQKLQLRILIADASFDSRVFLQQELVDTGYCSFAITGKEAFRGFQKALSLGHRYDLLIIDLNMSGMNGFDVIKSIRNLEKEDDLSDDDRVFIIVISSFSESAQLSEKLLSLGVNEILYKPIESGHISAIVKRFFL